MMRSAAILILGAAAVLAAEPPKTQNLILVTADGLRRQEVFTGIDPLLMREKAAGMEKAEALRRELWAETPEQRREKLMPFLWKTLASRGVILGNLDKGSAVTVTNRYRVSYPGYSEILTCRPQDDKVRNNDPIRNPHLTVLEFVRRKWNLERLQVALFASWGTFRSIGESMEGTIFLNAGYQEASGTPRLTELSRAQFAALSPWDEVRHDYITLEMALEYLKTFKPRFLYVSLGETDDWAHNNRYDRVLRTAQYFDQALKRIWETAQSLDQYRNRTSMLVSSDHGRGSRLDDWSKHGDKVAGAEYIWMAALGPDIPSRGEASKVPAVHQRDVSATLLALAGLAWREFCEDQGRPVPQIINTQ